jgi:hypothetical protein
MQGEADIVMEDCDARGADLSELRGHLTCKRCQLFGTSLTDETGLARIGVLYLKQAPDGCWAPNTTFNGKGGRRKSESRQSVLPHEPFEFVRPETLGHDRGPQNLEIRLRTGEQELDLGTPALRSHVSQANRSHILATEVDKHEIVA